MAPGRGLPVVLVSTQGGSSDFAELGRGAPTRTEQVRAKHAPPAGPGGPTTDTPSKFANNWHVP